MQAQSTPDGGRDDLLTAMGAATLVANFEVLAMAAKVDLPLSRLIPVINESTGSSYLTQVEIPRFMRGEAGGALALTRLQSGLRQTLMANTPVPILGYSMSMLLAVKHLNPSLASCRDLADAIAGYAGVSMPWGESEADSLSNWSASATQPVVGYVGLGIMGAALARQALKAARAVYVHDVRPESVAALVAQGAQPVANLAEMARVCDIILLCVPGAKEVRAVIFGESGLATGLSAGKIIIDQTTGSPTETRQLAQELAARGVALVDAPVAGGASGVDQGAFQSFCGGEPEAVRAAADLLKKMGSRVECFGGAGTGHAAKLVKNALAICNRFIAYEGMSLAIEKGRRLDVGTSAEGYWRTAAIDRLLEAQRTGAPSATIRLELLAKDQGLICGLGAASEAPMGVANLVRAAVAMAVRELGQDANIDEIGQFFGLNVDTE